MPDDNPPLPPSASLDDLIDESKRLREQAARLKERMDVLSDRIDAATATRRRDGGDED